MAGSLAQATPENEYTGQSIRLHALQPGLHRQVQKIAGSIAWATQTGPKDSMQALQPGLHRQVQKIAGSIAWATQTRPQASPSDSMHFKKQN